jgi:phosphonoacetate hydrolase
LARVHDLDRALDVLLSADLEPIVDMVVRATGEGRYEASSADGWVSFRRVDGGYERFDGAHDDPLANQSSDVFVGLDIERADPHPARRDNAYPFAYDHVAQLFDHPAAPDLCVLHSAAHNWEDQGGHRGEHGSLGVIQARAPLVVAGKGIRADGFVPRVARLVDVAPTIAALLGCRADGRGKHLAGQDGVVLDDVLDAADGRPAHVVGFLFDGVNANVLYEMARAGEAPNVARLVEMGTAYEWGAMAGLPTVTLANHTSILTGRQPGHHGILHNAWYERSTGTQVITNSQATWPWAMQQLLAGVESVHDVIHRSRPGSFTASVNEPCDLGADYSTFEYFRRGEVPAIPESAQGLPHTTERFVRPSKDYAWSSVVDHLATEQAVGIWGGHYRDVSFPPPTFMWCNFTLTDSAFHVGGPYSDIAAASVRDCDARLGDVLTAVERAGAFDDAAFLLVADHGMQETDPSVRGDWDVALREAGIKFRDEGYSFLYVGDE